MNFASEVLPVILSAVFGGSGLVTWLLAFKERRVKQQIDENKAVAAMQEVYSQFVLDTTNKIDELKKEITKLKKIIENNPPACPTCPNIKKTS